jgi:hypothetical protein
MQGFIDSKGRAAAPASWETQSHSISNGTISGLTTACGRADGSFHRIRVGDQSRVSGPAASYVTGAVIDIEGGYSA